MFWVLLVVLSTGNSNGGVTSQTIEFGNETLCREAAAKIVEANKRPYVVTATCVEKKHSDLAM